MRDDGKVTSGTAQEKIIANNTDITKTYVEQAMDTIENELKQVEDAVAQIKACIHLKTILTIILAFGNFMNHGESWRKYDDLFHSHHLSLDPSPNPLSALNLSLSTSLDLS